MTQNLEVVRLLDYNGADARIMNEEQISAIDLAVHNEYKEIKL